MTPYFLPLSLSAPQGLSFNKKKGASCISFFASLQQGGEVGGKLLSFRAKNRRYKTASPVFFVSTGVDEKDTHA